MTRILPYFYNAAPLGCRSSFVKHDAQGVVLHGHDSSLFQYPGLRDVQTGRWQGRSERGGAAYCFWYVELLSDARTMRAACFNIPLGAEVVEWQTRTFEGRVAQAVRVQVPPSAPTYLECSEFRDLASGGFPPCY